MPDVRRHLHITITRKTRAIRETSEPNRGFDHNPGPQRNELVRIRRLTKKRGLLYRWPARGSNRGNRPESPRMVGGDASR